MKLRLTNYLNVLHGCENPLLMKWMHFIQALLVLMVSKFELWPRLFVTQNYRMTICKKRGRLIHALIYECISGLGAGWGPWGKRCVGVVGGRGGGVTKSNQVTQHFVYWYQYNRNTAWLRDTVRQTSRGKSAAAGRTAGSPRPLTSRGTSAWPYRVTTQYSFYPVQMYS